jgi:restriction system protein
MRNSYEWERFDNEVKKLTEEVAALTYDGFTVPEWKPSPIDIDTTDRFLLPRWSIWLSPEQLFVPLPYPPAPKLPLAPSRIQREGVSLRARDTLREMIEAKQRAFEETFNVEVAKLSALKANYAAEDPEALVTLIELADKRHAMTVWIKPIYQFRRKARHNPINIRMTDGFHAFADPEARAVLVELKFPDYAKHQFQIGKYKDDRPKYATASDKKKLVRKCLYSIVIRAGYLASLVLNDTSYRTVAVNVTQDWFDPATGTPRSGIICSLQAQVSDFVALDLSQVDPEACFRHFKGIATPSFDSISQVRPILVLNKNDERFVAAKNLESLLEPDENLAAMPWEDFEHLVAQLFEWEFAKEGVEVRVTRASRDRGVDAILFDPDPLRGGKFVLQAKRYTKPVDVAAVRDLYGTAMNEGANRGILITTSSYGPDAYEFAKNKPLSLVDGPNLLRMLQRHGKNFRIDLEEARRLYRENEL